MRRLDFKKEHREAYTAKRGKVKLVNVPAMGCLTVDGVGGTEGEDFQEGVGAILGVAYTIKNLPQLDEMPVDYTPYEIPPTETMFIPEAELRWRILIPQPSFVNEALVTRAKVVLKSNRDPPGLERVGFVNVDEGECVQTLHVGPYEGTWEAAHLLEDHIASQGWEVAGDHHEVYLSDPRKTRQDRLRTIVRLPFRRVHE